MAAAPQQLQLLQELLSTLNVLSEARFSIEGEAALLRGINADLSAIVRRLWSCQRPPQQAAGSSSTSSTSTGGGAAGTTSTHPDGRRNAAAAKATQATRTGQQACEAPKAAAGQTLPPPSQQRLPAEFAAAVARYASLLQAATNSSSSSTQPAAAEGFMQRLKHAYGPSLADMQQQQQQQWCSPEEFARQARFLGLVSVALWAVQQLRSSSPPMYQPIQTPLGSPGQQQLQQLLPALLAHCQAWLADHSSREMVPEGEGSGSSSSSSRAADAVRYRNSCLYALLCEQAAAEHPGGAAAAAAAHPPGVWLPPGCWQPLVPFEGSDGAGWQQLLLLPRLPAVAVGPSASSSRSVPQQQQQPRLQYADVSELQLLSRQLLKLQQLLLQLAVESQAAPKLLEQLLRGCMELRSGAQSSSRSGMTHERCSALYRLVAALAAGPVKRRGLGGSCQLVQEQQVADASLIDWGG